MTNDTKRAPSAAEAIAAAAKAAGIALPTRRVVETGPCACGCGERTQATWAPGHDQRAVRLIAESIAGVKGADHARARRIAKAPADADPAALIAATQAAHPRIAHKVIRAAAARLPSPAPSA